MGCALTKAQKKAIEEAYNAVEENGEDEQTAEPKELKLLLLGDNYAHIFVAPCVI